MSDGRSEWHSSEKGYKSNIGLSGIRGRKVPSEMPTGFDYLSHDNALQIHWVKRLVAIVIDSLLIWVPLMIFFTLLGFHPVLPSLLFGPLLFVYAAMFELMTGGTLGKMLMHMKAVSMHGHMTSVQAFVRNFSKVFPVILLLDWIIGMAVETTDPRQKWSDKLVHTAVIAVDRPGGT